MLFQDPAKRIRRQATTWEKYLQKTSLIRDCHQSTQRTSKFHIKDINEPVKMGKNKTV